MKEIEVTRNEAGQRLDRFLKNLCQRQVLALSIR